MVWAMHKAIVVLLSFTTAGAASGAAGATSVDAPGDMLLFALGVTGLLIGRRIRSRRRNRNRKHDG
ncbi:MAG: hypothetical protein ABR601_02505 [Parasphingopyxis sp.]|nr:hypothetical protein [Sphingomonadales bacterium]